LLKGSRMSGFDTITPIETNETEVGTNVGRFALRRGHLIMKELKPIATVNCEYNQKIRIETLILSVVNTSQQDRSFGVRLEHFNEDEQSESLGFMDFDEIDEVTGALKFIGQLTIQMQAQQRDYTEVTYVTRGSVKFGFYLSNGSQQCFIDVSGGGRLVFLAKRTLELLNEALTISATHLRSRGAQA
jgi:hypothetical protein